MTALQDEPHYGLGAASYTYESLDLVPFLAARF